MTKYERYLMALNKARAAAPGEDHNRRMRRTYTAMQAQFSDNPRVVSCEITDPVLLSVLGKWSGMVGVPQ